MIKHKPMQRFMFGTATYVVSDKAGSVIMLKIDYEHNVYALDDAGAASNEGFRQEVAAIAADLLRRKHGVNFAKQLR